MPFTTITVFTHSSSPGDRHRFQQNRSRRQVRRLRDLFFNNSQVESLYAENLDPDPDHQLKPGLLRLRFSGSGNPYATCFRDIHPPADPAGTLPTDSDFPNGHSGLIYDHHSRDSGHARWDRDDCASSRIRCGSLPGQRGDDRRRNGTRQRPDDERTEIH